MRLKELRNYYNMTQDDVGEKLNVTGQTILNWENSIYEPRISQLIQLADIFNVTIDYLIGRPSQKAKINEIGIQLNKIDKNVFIDFIKDQLSKY